MLMTGLFYLVPVAIVLALGIIGFGAFLWLRSEREDLGAPDVPSASEEAPPISKAEAARSTSWLI
jgi:nitrogen fixation-related uncharacterized protein